METSSVGCHILTALLVPHFNSFHHIIVFRGVDANCRSDGEAVAQNILSVDVSFMGVVGSKTVGGVQIVGRAAVGDNVHRTAQRIAAEPCGHHSLVDFDVLDEVHRQAGESHTGTLGVERHTIDEVTDGVARHTVNTKVEVGAYSTLLPYFHACGAVHQTTE